MFSVDKTLLTLELPTRSTQTRARTHLQAMMLVLCVSFFLLALPVLIVSWVRTALETSHSSSLQMSVHTFCQGKIQRAIQLTDYQRKLEVTPFQALQLH